MLASHNAQVIKDNKISASIDFLDSNEPCHEKTCLLGFLPGPTLIGMYSQRKWLEA